MVGEGLPLARLDAVPVKISSSEAEKIKGRNSQTSPSDPTQQEDRTLRKPCNKIIRNKFDRSDRFFFKRSK